MPEGSPPSSPMKIGFWNVRGLNRPLKHNGVAHLIKNNHLCLLGILETKLAASNIPKILSRSFLGWCKTNNFDTIAGRRILVVWNPAVIDLHLEDISPQMIHCRATNKSSQLSFYISFTYGLYFVVNRRRMWEKFTDLGQTLSMSWLIMGDFNSLGLLDAPTTGSYSHGIPTAKATPFGASLIKSSTTMNGSRPACIAAPISTHQDASPTILRV
ncbi:UNVERIFIED_CONTAM: hypothetical protein Sindi_1460300 [Sesamum indicum]